MAIVILIVIVSSKVSRDFHVMAVNYETVSLQKLSANGFHLTF